MPIKKPSVSTKDSGKHMEPKRPQSKGTEKSSATGAGKVRY